MGKRQRFPKKDMTGNPLERFLRESKQFIQLERQAEVEATEDTLRTVPKKVQNMFCEMQIVFLLLLRQKYSPFIAAVFVSFR